MFYFTGLPGFAPLVHASHFGAASGAGYGVRGRGQIRVNMFVGPTWQLREFHLRSRCDAGGCRLAFVPVTVKNNPFHELFNPSASAPRGSEFTTRFPAQVSSLASDRVAQISMSTEEAFNAAQSTTSDPSQNYALQLSRARPLSPLSVAITEKLRQIGRQDLMPENIAARATTQSCAGCHELSNGSRLGGKNNPAWPFSRGFFHVSEAGLLSPALWCSFLPARKAVLDGFANSARRACGPHIPKQPVIVLEPGLSASDLPAVSTSELTVAGRTIAPN